MTCRQIKRKSGTSPLGKKQDSKLSNLGQNRASRGLASALERSDIGAASDLKSLHRPSIVSNTRTPTLEQTELNRRSDNVIEQGAESFREEQNALQLPRPYLESQSDSSHHLPRTYPEHASNSTPSPRLLQDFLQRFLPSESHPHRTRSPLIICRLYPLVPLSLLPN
jgi:hypothetical protein